MAHAPVCTLAKKRYPIVNEMDNKVHGYAVELATSHVEYLVVYGQCSSRRKAAAKMTDLVSTTTFSRSFSVHFLSAAEVTASSTTYTAPPKMMAVHRTAWALLWVLYGIQTTQGQVTECTSGNDEAVSEARDAVQSHCLLQPDLELHFARCRECVEKSTAARPWWPCPVYYSSSPCLRVGPT